MNKMLNEYLLKKNIEAVILELAPKFEVSPEELIRFSKPKYMVKDKIGGEQLSDGKFMPQVRGRFNSKDVAFEFSTNCIDIPMLLGEEVSHYLHSQLNRKLRDSILSYGIKNENFWRGIELNEMVGKYGGLVYTFLKTGEFKKLPWGSFLNSDSGFINALDTLAHDKGYRRAYSAFEKHGDKLLPRIARMSLEESIKTLPELVPITLYEKRIMPVLRKHYY